MAKATDFEAIRYSEDEMNFRSQLIATMMLAKIQRDNEHVEFEGQNYETWWVNNNLVRGGYIKPKENASDVNATTGTAREKTNTMLSSLLNLNLEPSIEAYNSDGLYVQELGKTIEDMERKSRELECPNYDIKRAQIYDEYLTQGTVFSEESYLEFSIPKIIVEKLDLTNVEAMEIKRGMDRVEKYCNTNLLIGLNVYLGNIREPNIEKQPFVFTRRVLSKSEAKSIYGKWSRFKNVPCDGEDFFPQDNESKEYNDWTLTDFKANYYEELKWFDKWNNRYMVILNGVMMFPVKKDDDGFITMPLSSILGVSEYPIAKGDYEPINNFAYSRSIPSKTKVEQELFDEMVKAIVFKTRQSYKPPMANFTGTELSGDIFDPGTIWDEVDPDKIKPLLPQTGVTQSEFQMTQFIKSIIDEKSVSPIMEGQEPGTRATATQILEQRRMGMQRMGAMIIGIASYERQRTQLRVWNILNNWTQPTKLKDGLSRLKDEYKSLTIDTTYPTGKGKKIVNFTSELPSSQQVNAMDKIMSKVTNTTVKNVYLNPEELRKTLNWFFQIIIIPKPKEDSAIKVAQFSEFLKSAMLMSQSLGIPLKGAEALARFATLNGEDPDEIFDLSPQQQQQQNMGMQPMQPQGNMQGQGPEAMMNIQQQVLNKQLIPKTPNMQPSIKELAMG